ncbi:hypothetical protein [Streptomyces avermitilis]|uniref:hypothetical protein n=1 Tax=Streptomyces avermitilis TaxID=33903 RepID=UPI0036936A12
MQRARVRGLMARAEQAAQQISMALRENALRVEPVINRLNDRFGPGTVTPGSLAHRRRA